MRPLPLIRQASVKRDPHQASRALRVREQPKESLESIRQEAEKRSRVVQREAERGKKDEGLKKLKQQEEVKAQKDKKSEKEEIEIKRRELAQLQVDIEREKSEAAVAGTSFIAEAKKEAHDILLKARKTESAAESLKKQLTDKLDEVKKETTVLQKEGESLVNEYAGLKHDRDTLLEEQKEIAQRRKHTHQALAEAQTLLSHLAALTKLVAEKADALMLLSDDQSAQTVAAIGDIGRAVKVLKQNRQILQAKEEQLDRQAKANEAKWEWIKEQRLELRMAQQDPKVEKIHG